MGPFADADELDRVRCLECGTTYAKPAEGGTVHENPGCPRCGYLGWVRETPVRAGEQPRSDAGRLRPASGRPR